MGSVGRLLKFSDLKKILKKILKKFGIEWDASRGKGSHGVFVGLSHVTRIREVYPIPKSQQRQMSDAYLRPLRRTFELTEKDGVSDDEFFS